MTLVMIIEIYFWLVTKLKRRKLVNEREKTCDLELNEYVFYKVRYWVHNVVDMYYHMHADWKKISKNYTSVSVKT